MQNLGLYLHIPFCRSKCLYCDFCSVPHPTKERMERYAARLCEDLVTRAADCCDYEVDTVYFGGGTPTCLSPTLLCDILDTVRKYYHVAWDAEITAECNPGTVAGAELSALRRGGFNRLSIGLQSAQEKELRALGRLHRFSDFEETFSAARDAGFENLSADLMFGIPHQTAHTFCDTLEKLCALRPDHISAYALTVEEGTPFGRRGADKLDLPDEETVREMYLGMVAFLRVHGYEQYEISNFARVGYRSRHNLKYWNLGEYLGFGPAAYSDFAGERFGNTRDIEGYLNGLDLTAERERPSKCVRENERVMLGMRLTEGVTTADLGAARCRTLERLIPLNLVVRRGDRFALTPEGMLVSNAILADTVDFSDNLQ